MYDITECPVCYHGIDREEVKKALDDNIKNNPVKDMDEKRVIILDCLCFNRIRVKIEFDYYYTYETVK